MNILLLSPVFKPDVGGVETMLSKFCDYLNACKHETVVMTYSPLVAKTRALFRERLGEYVRIIRIPWIGRGLFNVFEDYPPIQFFYLVPALTIWTLFFLLFTRKKPEIIHAFGLSAAFAGGLASRIYGIPCIVDMCTVYRFQKRPKLAWFVKKMLNMADYIRGNNVVGKEELKEIGINPEKLGVITPPVDETIFKPIPANEAREKIGLPQSKFIALFVGRMVESKNVDVAVASSKLIKSKNVIFVFIGEGPLRKLVEEAAKTDKRIVTFGSVKHQDLVYYYNAGDILMCGAVDRDLISFVGREALLCGLPILALNVATYAGISYEVNENLIPSEIGHFTDPTPEAVADYLERIISRKEEIGVTPFNRDDCVRYGLDNFSQSAMDWIGESYEKAKKINLLRKSKK